MIKLFITIPKVKLPLIKQILPIFRLFLKHTIFRFPTYKTMMYFMHLQRKYPFSFL